MGVINSEGDEFPVLNTLFGIPTQVVHPTPAVPESQSAAQSTTEVTDLPVDNSTVVRAATTPSNQSLTATLNGVIQPNPLNVAFNPTYHFRLFMAPDGDILKQSGIGNVTNFANLQAALAKIPQVTIVESGVTGLNIREVHLTTLPAQNVVTRGQAATNVSMTVIEPMGISFFDNFVAAAKALNIANFAKCQYFLELTFKGYDEQGIPINPAKSVNGGYWLWALTPTNVQVKLNEGGSVYSLEFVSIETAGLTDDNDLYLAPDPITVVGDTIGEMYNDLVTKLNEKWEKKFPGGVVKFDPIQTHPVFLGPTHAIGKDPKTFSLKSKEKDKNSQQNFKTDIKQGKYTATLEKGYRITDFLIDAIKATEEGQQLHLDNVARDSLDDGDRFRETVSFSTEADVVYGQIDPVTKNYRREITIHVIPFYSQSALLTPEQVTEAQNPSVQRAMIQKIINGGLVKRRYDYIFTGLNTEVLDFDIDFKAAWQALLPEVDGAWAVYEDAHIAPKANANNVKPDLNYSATQPSQTLSPTAIDPGTATPINSSQQTPASAQNGTTAAFLNGTLFSGLPSLTNLTQTILNPQTAQAAITNLGSPEVRNIFSEDLLSQQTATNWEDFAVPISFWQGHTNIVNNTSQHNFVGQYQRDKTVLGAVLAQLLTNVPAITGSFERLGSGSSGQQGLRLVVRGDPYWLGQCNIHRQVLLRSSNLPSSGEVGIPDWSSARQVMYMTFQTPLQIGDDFKPVLKGSAVFNGFYEVNSVTNIFADGVFKQEIGATRMPAIDVSRAESAVVGTPV